MKFSSLKKWIFFYLLIFILSCGSEFQKNDHQFTAADSLIEQALRDDLFTGAVLLIGDRQGVLYEQAYGYATLYDESLRVVSEPDGMTLDHRFDIASLTKIFATTYGYMALQSDGVVNLDASIAQYLSEFDKDGYRDISIRHLLSHTSGLAPWFPTYYWLSNHDNILQNISEMDLNNHPGEERRYSDLGFIILGKLLEEITDRNFSEFLNERIYSKLNISNTGFGPLDETSKIVSTSHGNPFEKRMVYDSNFGYRIDVDSEGWDEWRTYTLKGEVNDGNAYYSLDGIAGHAGLFSTANDIYRLLLPVLNNGEFNEQEIFSSQTVEEFLKEDKFENGLGWGLSIGSTHRDESIQTAAGHTGFTGTNFLINKENGIVYILLTNRQHVGQMQDGNYPDLRELRVELSSLIK